MTTWIFQGNPNLFEVTRYLQSQREVLWSANQGYNKMAPGDLVYFWRSRGAGTEHAGILATGILLDEPQERAAEPAEAPYWKVPQGHGVARRVRIRVDETDARFLPAVYLAAQPILNRLEILRIPNATNFRVTDEQAAPLADAWAAAAKRSAAELLVSTLAERVRAWKADGSAQIAAREWSRTVAEARLGARTLFEQFLSGEKTLQQTKEEFDRRTRLAEWSPMGLMGANGAIVFNQWAKHLPEHERTPVLQAALRLPKSINEAEGQLRTLLRYLQSRIDSGLIAPGEAALSRAVPFVSAVWQILDTDARWPTFYTSARDGLFDARVLIKHQDVVRTYLDFIEVMAELRSQFDLDFDGATMLLPWAKEVAGDVAPNSVPTPPTGANRRTWLIAPGPQARHWDSWREEKVATIGWNELGDLAAFQSVEEVRDALREHFDVENPMNNQWACYDFSHSLQPGDLIFAKRGRREVVGYGRVAGAYRYDPKRTGDHHVVPVEWLQAKDVKLPDDQMLVLKTLTELTSYPELVQTLLGLFAEGVTEAEPVAQAEETRSAPYSREDALRDLFLDDAVVDDMLASLRRRKNLILQGPPGVGKTFVAQRLAFLLMEQKAREQLAVVQFHQSYGYEDFVQGFRPTESGGFRREDGPFVRFCQKALQDPRSPYVLIIDEINRGNVSRIFGELLMLLDADKRGPEWAVQLAYGRASEADFHVPENIYVIGTMNTADRSLALVDYALRRRFAFVDVPPGFETSRFADVLQSQGASTTLIEQLQAVLLAVNKMILEDPSLGAGYQVGHSYFCDGKPAVRDGDWLDRVLRLEIEPLLKEYWRDAPERLNAARKYLELG